MNASAINTSRNSHRRRSVSRRPFLGWKRPFLALVASILVLCLSWSFAVAPCAIAAHIKPPQKPVPHSLWMSPAKIAHMKAQTLKVLAMQQRAQKPGFRYRLAIAQRALRPINATHVTPPASLTLLDEVGLLAHPVLDTQAAAWRAELAAHPQMSRAALLHLWLGEWQLAHNQQPETAIGHFRAVQHLTAPSERLYGLAAYDRATAIYYEGAYADAVTAFHQLLARNQPLRGFDRRYAALWMRHAGACAGYHADRAKAGIPEPPRLDPLCGAAALATSLRALGQPYDKKTVLAAVRATGEGSTLQDVAAGAKTLGLSAYAVRADDQGLRLLPKPLVAYVEHDHFVSVVKADKKGVSYLCSDCGMWPGGQVNLTWKQWHLLNGGLYLAVTRSGSAADRLLTDLGGSQGQNLRTQSSLLTLPMALPFSRAFMPPSASGFISPASVTATPRRLAFLGELTDLHFSLRVHNSLLGNRPFVAALSPQLIALRGHVVLQHLAAVPSYCGAKAGAQHCVNPTTCCLTAGPGPGGPAPGPGKGSSPIRKALTTGPSAGDPVNLATGEEEYSPEPDISVYNPHGPSVSWDRLYNSLRRPGQGYVGDTTGDDNYEMNDFGEGWSHSYNVGVYDPTNGGTGTTAIKYVFFDNGARLGFTAPSAPNSMTPQVHCTTNAGTPFLVDWNYSPSGNYYAITWADRTQWVTTAALIGLTTCYALAKIVDCNGHAITFNYGSAAGGTFAWPLLSRITNEDGTALLTIVRMGDGSGNIAEVHDCYGRSVLYHVSAYAAHSGASPTGLITYAELDHVSQLVPIGTPAPADRYVYGYQNWGFGWTFLHTISVPNPTGAATPCTATINYDPTTQFVTSIRDANGNTVSFASVDVTGTSGGSGAPGSSGAPGGTLSATSSLPSNYTEVTYTNADGSTAYSSIGGYDMNMSGAVETDGAGHVTDAKTFDATSPNPYRPTAEADGNGNVTHYVYDQYGNLHQETSPRGTVTNYTYAFPSGQVPSVINSVAADSGFALGELVKEQVTAADGVTQKAPTTYAYYEPSGLSRTIIRPAPGTVGGFMPGATSQTPSVTYSLQYDDYGNVTSSTGPGNNASNTITETLNYTSDPGDASHGVAPASANVANSHPLTITDNLGHVTHFRYDLQGNTVAVIDALGNESDLTYNIANQRVNSVRPLTHNYKQRRYLYPDGPLVSLCEFAADGSMLRNQSYAYGREGETHNVSGSSDPVTLNYDALYRLASLSDGNGSTTHYQYNQQGYLSEITYPGAVNNVSGSRDTISYPNYDAAGNILQRVDGNGVTTLYSHVDAESKLTWIHYVYPNGYMGGHSGDVAFQYDGYGRYKQIVDAASGTLNADGSIATAGVVYGFDDADHTLSVKTSYTGIPTQTISYNYYPDGTMKAMNIPGAAFSYLYDAGERMQSLTNPYSETTSWTYYDNNWLATQNLANGFVSNYVYDAQGFLQETSGLKSGTATAYRYDLQYDEIGNPTTEQVGVGQVSGYKNYSYDYVSNTQAVQRRNLLTHEDVTYAGVHLDYGYDNISSTGPGNPTLFKGVSHSFNGNNQLTDSGFTYDGDGNPTTYAGQSLTFDPENRATGFGSVLTNAYNFEGLRASKQNSSGKTFFLYSDGMPVCELDGAGHVSAVNTFGVHGLVSRHNNTTSTLYAFDPQGNLLLRMDGSQNVLTTSDFDAYGNPLMSNSNADPFGYGAQSGYYCDTETGFYLLSHRYYDPSVGRFLTRDPIGYRGGVNLYEYADASPIDNSDPTGYWCWHTGLGCIGTTCHGDPSCPPMNPSPPAPKPAPPPPPPPPAAPPPAPCPPPTDPCTAMQNNQMPECAQMCMQIRDHGDVTEGLIEACCEEVHNQANPGNLPSPGIEGFPTIPAVDMYCAQKGCDWFNNHKIPCTRGYT